VSAAFIGDKATTTFAAPVVVDDSQGMFLNISSLYSVYVQSMFSLCSVYVQCDSFAILTLRSCRLLLFRSRGEVSGAPRTAEATGDSPETSETARRQVLLDRVGGGESSCVFVLVVNHIVDAVS
jgi:hypothetical protein